MNLFITETYIKTNSPITSNVDPKDLNSHILAAQNLYMKNILGSEFFDDLMTKYQAQTLSADEITLVQDYIQPAILWRGITIALPWLHTQLRNKGLMNNSDDNATQADQSMLNFLRNEAKNRAEYQEEELRKYLCKYNNLYPLYRTQDGLTKPDSSSNWDSGLLMY